MQEKLVSTVPALVFGSQQQPEAHSGLEEQASVVNFWGEVEQFCAKGLSSQLLPRP
jgi:hypothetical protein